MNLAIKPVGYGHLNGVLSFHITFEKNASDILDQDKLVELSNKLVELKNNNQFITIACIECFYQLKPDKANAMESILYVLRSNGLKVIGLTSPAYVDSWFTNCDYKIYAGVYEDYKYYMNSVVNCYVVDDDPVNGTITLSQPNQLVLYNIKKVKDYDRSINALSKAQSNQYGFCII